MTKRSFEQLVSDFEFLDDWEDRYKYVIELGRELPHFDEAFKTDKHKIHGCVSQVWIRSRLTEAGANAGSMKFCGDSDALIVKGLIAIVMALLSGKGVDEIVNTDAKSALSRLGLHEHLTPQRSNGLSAMIARIKTDAQQSIG